MKARSRVSVHSTVGEGTTFTVVLPMARQLAVALLHLQNLS